MHELRIERSANTHRLLRGKCEFSLMRCNIRSVNSTLRTARALNDPYGSNGWLSLLPPQTTTMSLMLSNIPSVDCTLWSVRKLNHPYGSNGSNGSLSLLPPKLSSNSYVSLMRCNLQSVNCTLRSVRALCHPYGSNGSLSLLPPHYHETALFSKSP